MKVLFVNAPFPPIHQKHRPSCPAVLPLCFLKCLLKKQDATIGTSYLITLHCAWVERGVFCIPTLDPDGTCSSYCAPRVRSCGQKDEAVLTWVWKGCFLQGVPWWKSCFLSFCCSLFVINLVLNK